MTIRKFVMPIYEVRVAVIVTPDMADVIRKYNLSFGTGPLKVAATAFSDDDLGYVMAFEDRTSYGVVAHESLHLCNRILKDIGVENMSIDQDEIVAYMLSWLVNKALESFKEKRK